MNLHELADHLVYYKAVSYWSDELGKTVFADVVGITQDGEGIMSNGDLIPCHNLTSCKSEKEQARRDEIQREEEARQESLNKDLAVLREQVPTAAEFLETLPRVLLTDTQGVKRSLIVVCQTGDGFAFFEEDYRFDHGDTAPLEAYSHERLLELNFSLNSEYMWDDCDYNVENPSRINTLASIKLEKP